MVQLLTSDQLPRGFVYPTEFHRIVELGLTNLEPWWIINGEVLKEKSEGLAKRFPSRTLVPFAMRQDRDDVACWDTQDGNVVVVHDFADPGYEQRERFVDFYAWLRRAIEDLIEFDL